MPSGSAAALYALEVDGDSEYWRGFVAGWGAASGIDPVGLARRVRDADDWSVRFEGRGMLASLRGRHRTLLVRDDTVAPLRAALATHGGELRERSCRLITAARFTFEFEIYGREEAAAVRALFEGLPAGVQLLDYAPVESIDPEAAGLELHGAVHDYVFSGSGTAGGDPGVVLALHERIRQHERIRSSDVVLELAA
jgi:hypothetical protein